MGEGVPVLALGCVSLNFARNGQPNSAAEHDLGAAGASLTLEATARGLFVHQMIGILPDRAREQYAIPDDVRPLTGIAIGYLGDANASCRRSIASATCRRGSGNRSRRSSSPADGERRQNWDGRSSA